MVNLFSKEFWSEDNAGQRNAVMGGMLRGSLAAEKRNASTGGLIGSVGLGYTQGQQRYSSSQAEASAAAEKAKRENDRIEHERQRIEHENSRLEMDQKKFQREADDRARSARMFKNMFPGSNPENPGAQKEQTPEYMPPPTGIEGGDPRHAQLRKNPLMSGFTDGQLDEIQRAGAFALSSGKNPMEAIAAAAKTISARDSITVMGSAEASEVLGAGYDPTKAYKYNSKTGNITTIGGGGVEITIGDKLTDKMKLEHYKRRMRTQDKTLESGRVASKTSQDMVPRLNMIIDALDSGVETGAITSLTKPLREYLVDAKWMGQKAVDQLSNQEVFEAGQNFLISRIRPEGSGQTSDMEYNSFAKAVPSLGKTTAGNKVIAKMTRQLAEYKIAENELMQRFLSNPENKLGDFPKHREMKIGSAIMAPKSNADAEQLLSLDDGIMFRNIYKDEKGMTRSEYVELTPEVRARIERSLGR